MVETESFFKTLLDNLHEGVYFVDPERRIQYWNNGAEKLCGFTSTDVEGSCCYNNILVHVDRTGQSLCQGKCPLAATLRDGEERTSHIFLRHKDGYRIPVCVSVAAVRDSEGRIIGGVETFHDETPLNATLRQLEDLKQSSLLCPVTGLPNRAHSETVLHDRVAEVRNGKSTAALLFIDLDHFKAVNDTYGHIVGDLVLKMAAETITRAVRTYDFIGRWGGDEFIAILPLKSDVELSEVAERLRALVEQSSRGVGEDRVGVTLSVGGSRILPSDTVESVVERVDQLMYRSKAQGRNQVSYAGVH